MGGGQTNNHSRQLGGSRGLREISGVLEKAAIRPKKAASSSPNNKASPAVRRK